MLRPVLYLVYLVYLVYNINIYFVCICVHFNCSPFHLGGGGRGEYECRCQ